MIEIKYKIKSWEELEKLAEYKTDNDGLYFKEVDNIFCKSMKYLCNQEIEIEFGKSNKVYYDNWAIYKSWCEISLPKSLIKQMKEIIGDNPLCIEMIDDKTIVILVYEIQIPIFYIEGFIYIDCKTFDYKIYKDMLLELYNLVELLEANKIELKSWL